MMSSQRRPASISELVVGQAEDAVAADRIPTDAWLATMGDELVTALETQDKERISALRERVAAFGARVERRREAETSPSLEAWTAITRLLAETLSVAATRAAALRIRIQPGTLAYKLLDTLASSERLLNSEARLELPSHDKTAISRAWRQLFEQSLVIRRSLGRNVLWEITPRGRAVAKAIGCSLPASAESHLLNLYEAEKKANEYHRLGLRVVFTSGSFDILNSGYVHYLEEARRRGNVLFVGLNDAESVRELQRGHEPFGIERPILDTRDRVTVLAALRCVDHVVVFSRSNARELVAKIRPDLYIEGEDVYSESPSPEAQAAEANGGKWDLLPSTGEELTTRILRRMVDSVEHRVAVH